MKRIVCTLLFCLLWSVSHAYELKPLGGATQAELDAEISSRTAADFNIWLATPTFGTPYNDAPIWNAVSISSATEAAVRQAAIADIWLSTPTFGSGTNDHSALSNLSYGLSGHTGFASQSQYAVHQGSITDLYTELYGITQDTGTVDNVARSSITTLFTELHTEVTARQNGDYQIWLATPTFGSGASYNDGPIWNAVSISSSTEAIQRIAADNTLSQSISVSSSTEAIAREAKDQEIRNSTGTLQVAISSTQAQVNADIANLSSYKTVVAVDTTTLKSLINTSSGSMSIPSIDGAMYVANLSTGMFSFTLGSTITFTTARFDVMTAPASQSAIFRVTDKDGINLFNTDLTIAVGTLQSNIAVSTNTVSMDKRVVVRCIQADGSDLAGYIKYFKIAGQ